MKPIAIPMRFFLLALLLLSSLGLDAQQTVTYRETFDADKGDWTIRENAQVSAKVSDGKYLLHHKRTSGSWLFWKNSIMLDPENEFEIETEMTQLSGDPEHGYGFVWGAQDAANFYGFIITGSGKYRLFRYKEAEYQEMKGFTRASQIVRPQGSPNILTIRNHNNFLSFYINEEYIYGTAFQSFMGPKAGYILYDDNQIEVEHLTIRQEKTLPVAYMDDFEAETSGWVRGDDSGDKSSLTEGKYRIHCTEPGEVTVEYKEFPVSASLDFVLESTMIQQEGDEENGFGLIVAARDPRDSYAFIVSSDGTYLISEWVQGEHQTVQDWTEALHSIRGIGEENKLSIRRIGDETSFYANDHFLFKHTMPDLAIARVGFVVYDTLTIDVEDLRVRVGSATVRDLPPTLTMLSPSNDLEVTDQPDFSLEVGINSPAELSSANIYLNGMIFPGNLNTTSPDPGFDASINEVLSLQEGMNEIKIVVKTRAGGSVTETRQVQFNKDQSGRNGEDYALFFATDDYDNWTNLVNPVNDVNTIAKELSESYGFNTEVVVNPTRTEILNKLKEYAKKTYRPEDQLMLFFAGHGKFDEFFGEGYVVAKNSLKDDEGNGTYISHSSLRTIVSNIPCSHIFLAMDVCFGGTIDPFIASSGHRGDEENYKEMTQGEFIKRKMKYRTRRYLTSGGKEYVPDGKPGHHSPYARKFLEALRFYGGHDRIITMSEFLVYFERLIPAPRTGEFGTNEPGSDFLFIAK